MVRAATSLPFSLLRTWTSGESLSAFVFVFLSFLPSTRTHVLLTCKAPMVVVIDLSNIYIDASYRRHLTNGMYLLSTIYPVSTARCILLSDFTLADGSYTAYKNTPTSFHLLEPLEIGLNSIGRHGHTPTNSKPKVTFQVDDGPLPSHDICFNRG